MFSPCLCHELLPVMLSNGCKFSNRLCSLQKQMDSFHCIKAGLEARNILSVLKFPVLIAIIHDQV